MRYFCSILLTLLISFNTSATVSSVDKKLVDMLLSGKLRQLKIAAQEIDDKEISDPSLLDIAAEILLKKYPDAYSSEIDTLAWIARAIGSSENGRYHSVLSEVMNNSNDKKLAKYARKARRKLDNVEVEQYLSGMYQLPEKLYAREDDATRDQRIMGLMMAGDLSSLKQGAQTIVYTNAQNLALIDTAAEILITHYATALIHQIDTFAWLTNAIGQSGSGRYVDLLTEVEQNAENKKLRKYAKKALKALGEPENEQYKKGLLGKEIPNYDF
jgi:hypothetical protein